MKGKEQGACPNVRKEKKGAAGASVTYQDETARREETEAKTILCISPRKKLVG